MATACVLQQTIKSTAALGFRSKVATTYFIK
jgi:hypothetical protein